LKALTTKEWLIAFILPLVVGIILWVVSTIPNWPSSQKILYFDLTVLNDVTDKEPKTLKQSGEIKIYNFNSFDVSNIDLVIPGFTKSNAKFNVDRGFRQPILAEPITASSVDENGVLRIKYKKIFAQSDASITFSIDDGLFMPHEVQSTTEDIDIQPILMVKPSPPAQNWMNIYIALPLIQIVLSICLFLVLKASIKNPQRQTRKTPNV
jgi:hypothetical protein